LYYPLGTNTCPDCSNLLGTNLTNIEKHLKSHNFTKLEYRCGVCDKVWPSWRSVITHYSKSNCRQVTSTTSPSNIARTQVSSNNINHRRKSVENTSTQQPILAIATNEESEADEQVEEPPIRKKSHQEKERRLNNNNNTQLQLYQKDELTTTSPIPTFR
jgi:hypothetical protein